MNEYKDYSIDDLQQYYGGCHCYTKDLGLVSFYNFEEGPQRSARLQDRLGVKHIVPLKDVIEQPQYNQLFNGRYMPFFLIRRPARQYKRGASNANVDFHQVKQWYGDHNVAMAGIGADKYDNMALTFQPAKYPTFEDAIKELADGKRVSVAFSPKFAVCIPFLGENLTIMRMDYPVGKVKDGKCILNKQVSFFKEELEQFAPVEVDE